MVLSETLIVLTMIILGLVMLYKGYEYEEVDVGFVFSFIATSLFITGIMVSTNVPFSVNGSGEIIGTASNLALIGINLLFGLIALLVSIIKAYAIFGVWSKK